MKEAKIIINGKIYTLYEFEILPRSEPNLTEAIHEEMRRKEKISRERDWKHRARSNYQRKK